MIIENAMGDCFAIEVKASSNLKRKRFYGSKTFSACRRVNDSSLVSFFTMVIIPPLLVKTSMPYLLAPYGHNQ